MYSWRQLPVLEQFLPVIGRHDGHRLSLLLLAEWTYRCLYCAKLEAAARRRLFPVTECQVSSSSRIIVKFSVHLFDCDQFYSLFVTVLRGLNNWTQFVGLFHFISAVTCQMAPRVHHAGWPVWLVTMYGVRT